MSSTSSVLLLSLLRDIEHSDYRSRQLLGKVIWFGDLDPRCAIADLLGQPLEELDEAFYKDLSGVSTDPPRAPVRSLMGDYLTQLRQ